VLGVARCGSLKRKSLAATGFAGPGSPRKRAGPKSWPLVRIFRAALKSPDVSARAKPQQFDPGRITRKPFQRNAAGHALRYRGKVLWQASAIYFLSWASRVAFRFAIVGARAAVCRSDAACSDSEMESSRPKSSARPLRSLRNTVI